MAVFNPNINPTNDPEYINATKAIDVPTPAVQPKGVQQNQLLPEGPRVVNKAPEYLGDAQKYASMAQGVAIQADAAETKAWGDLLQTGAAGVDFLVKGTDAVIKKQIENEVYDRADKERTEWTNRLEALKSNTQGQKLLGAEDANAQAIPGELEDLDTALATWSSAKDSGKISPTYYHGKLLSHAKELRAKYPGYREYIDSKFAGVTGVNPANAYAQSLMTEINRNIASVGNQQNRALRLIEQNMGIKDAEILHALVGAGKANLNDVVSFIAPHKRLEAVRAEIKANREMRDWKRADDAETVLQEEELNVQQRISLDFNNINRISALNGKDTSMLLQDLANKRITLAPGQLEEIYINQKNRREALFTEIWEEMTKKGPDGKSTIQRMRKTPEEAQKWLRSNFVLYDTMLKQIAEKDWDMATLTEKKIQAITHASDLRIIQSPIGEQLLTLESVKKRGGDVAITHLTSRLMGGNFPQNVGDYVTQGIADLISPAHNYVTGGIPKNYVKEKIENAKRHLTTIVPPSRMPSVYKEFFSQVELIGKDGVGDEVQERALVSTFHPINNDVLESFAKDGRDEKGRQITGRQAVFNQLTKKDVVDGIKSLVERTGKPELWKMYVNSVGRALNHNLIRRELQDLNTIVEHPGMDLKYDPQNHQFRVDFKPEFKPAPQTGTAFQRNYVQRVHYTDKLVQQQVRESVARLNMGLYSFAQIAKVSGIDVNQFLIKTIKDWTLADKIVDIKGVPQVILNQVLSPQGNQEIVD